MKAKTYVLTMRRVRVGCVLVLVAVAAAAGAWLARQYGQGGSCITNPDAQASAHIAAGLRAAGR